MSNSGRRQIPFQSMDWVKMNPWDGGPDPSVCGELLDAMIACRLTDEEVFILRSVRAGDDFSHIGIRVGMGRDHVRRTLQGAAGKLSALQAAFAAQSVKGRDAARLVAEYHGTLAGARKAISALVDALAAL